MDTRLKIYPHEGVLKIPQWEHNRSANGHSAARTSKKEPPTVNNIYNDHNNNLTLRLILVINLNIIEC